MYCKGDPQKCLFFVTAYREQSAQELVLFLYYSDLPEKINYLSGGLNSRRQCELNNI